MASSQAVRKAKQYNQKRIQMFDEMARLLNIDFWIYCFSIEIKYIIESQMMNLGTTYIFIQICMLPCCQCGLSKARFSSVSKVHLRYLSPELCIYFYWLLITVCVCVYVCVLRVSWSA